MAPSSDGNKVVLTLRGRMFVVPVGQGRLVEVSREQGVRFRHAGFLGNDNSQLLFQSDQSGEVEFWTISADGRKSGKKLTQNAGVLLNAGLPSPDGQWVVFADKNNRLCIFNRKKKVSRVIHQSDVAGSCHPAKNTDATAGENTFNFAWSPDSQWLAFTRDAPNGFAQICLYSVNTGQYQAVTSDRVYSYSPAWSSDGQWLYFLSDRHFDSRTESPWGQNQPEPYFDKTTKVYQLALQKGHRSPFKAQDEVADNASSSRKDDDTAYASAEKKHITVELEGLQERIYPVPVEAGAYQSLIVTERHLFMVEPVPGASDKKRLCSVEISRHKPGKNVVLEGENHFVFSQDKSHLLVKINKEFGDKELYMIDVLSADPKNWDMQKMDVSGLNVSVDPREEWRQMLVDAWRMERDYFYDPNMHGQDWNAIKEKYLPLVDRITDRDELDDVLAQMISELGALHAFVIQGDSRRGSDYAPVSFLGAELKRDHKLKGDKIVRIYQADPDYPENLSPLQQTDSVIKEGDIIEKIDGVSVMSVPDSAALLKGKAGKQVLLSIRSQRHQKCDVIVRPISFEEAESLRYAAWEYSRRLEVDQVSGHSIGYIHLRAMDQESMARWMQQYYPVSNRKGLIIDVRHNQGGNIDSWLLSRLLRQPWFYWKFRQGKPFWNMPYAFQGSIVVLCDANTCSDVEVFAEGVRRLGLGKVIGTRTWGGNIWLDYQNKLLDNGIASVPSMGVYLPDGKQFIEGIGVHPDVIIDNLPHATFNGADAQLDAAVHYLQEKIASQPQDTPLPLSRTSGASANSPGSATSVVR